MIRKVSINEVCKICGFDSRIRIYDQAVIISISFGINIQRPSIADIANLAVRMARADPGVHLNDLIYLLMILVDSV